MKKILFIAGTRPEAIKLAPVYLEMGRREAIKPILCATGQHADLFRHGLDVFEIAPDFVLETMRESQSLTGLTGALFVEIGAILERVAPDLVVVQGDTASAHAGAWAGFLQKIPVLHVEAGLRTGNLEHPFPEEANRRAVSVVARYHAAPTAQARDNLLREGVDPAAIVVSGNTAIDALLFVKEKLVQGGAADLDRDGQRRILVTGHRRENFGAGLEGICTALRAIAEQFPDVTITYAVHPNPAVSGPVRQMLDNSPNVRLTPPLDYPEFVAEMMRSYFLISDSGGVQEEAPALGKPVLVTRTVTERPEAAAIGATRLVGTLPETIVGAARELLTDESSYRKMAAAGSPYGDGRAAEVICDFVTG